MSGRRHARNETTRRHKDGTLIEVQISAGAMTDETGTTVGLSVIAHDITERRKEQGALEASQRRLAEAQRIARLGVSSSTSSPAR